MKTSVHILMSPESNTLGSLRSFLKELEPYNIDTSVELVDGGHVSVNDSEPLMDSHPSTLEGLIQWASEFSSLPDDTLVQYLTDLSVEPLVYRVENILCGSHIAYSPENIMVTVNPNCVSD